MFWTATHRRGRGAIPVDPKTTQDRASRPGLAFRGTRPPGSPPEAPWCGSGHSPALSHRWGARGGRRRPPPPSEFPARIAPRLPFPQSAQARLPSRSNRWRHASFMGTSRRGSRCGRLRPRLEPMHPSSRPGGGFHQSGFAPRGAPVAPAHGRVGLPRLRGSGGRNARRAPRKPSLPHPAHPSAGTPRSVTLHFGGHRMRVCTFG